MLNKENLFIRAFINWLPLAVAITGVCGLAYVAVQQNYRQNANDPQIDILESLGDALNQGAPPAAVVPQSNTNLATSLQPFVIVYSSTSTPIVSSAVLDGKTPIPPNGVFEQSKVNGQNRLTWQPKEGVRIAAVVGTYKDGYILAGRSLKEVEKRISLLTEASAAAWIATLLLSYLFKVLVYQISSKKETEPVKPV